MGRVLLDTRCDCCHFEIIDDYDTGGKETYGDCPECGKGQMRQILRTGGFNMNPQSSLNGKTGRTSDGTKWEVKGQPRKYDVKTGKWGSETY